MQPYIGGVSTVRRCYLIACAGGVVGIVALVGAPGETSGSVAALLAAGALPLTRTFGAILVNSQAVSEVRATVHSLLAQAEYLGAVVCGLVVAAVARYTDLSLAFLTCGVLLLIAVLSVHRLALPRTAEVA